MKISNGGLRVKCAARNCKSTIRRGLPYCCKRNHLQRKLGLEVKRSTIDGAGLGVFACRRFESGQRVCRYHSERLRKREYERRYGKTDWQTSYLLELDEFYVDGTYVRGVDAMINDGLSDEKNNVEFLESGVYATRDIEIGQEIFVSYGPAYWVESSDTSSNDGAPPIEPAEPAEISEP